MNNKKKTLDNIDTARVCLKVLSLDKASDQIVIDGVLDLLYEIKCQVEKLTE